MTTQEKVSKLKSIVDKDIAIYCETVEEDRALCELANDYFYGGYDFYLSDSHYVAISIGDKVEINVADEDELDGYEIIPYSEFFKDGDFNTNTINREDV